MAKLKYNLLDIWNYEIVLGSGNKHILVNLIYYLIPRSLYSVVKY